MADKVTRLLILSQFSLFGFLLVCYLLNPIFLTQEGGVSNYGVHRLTVVPYSLAFGLCGLFTVLAARSIPRTSRLFIALALTLKGLALSFIVVLLTTYPYNVNGFFDWLHKGAGIMQFLFGISLAFWLAIGVSRDWLNVLLLIVQTVASLAALFTLLGTFHLLFVSQLVAGLAFGTLLVRAVAQLNKSSNVPLALS